MGKQQKIGISFFFLALKGVTKWCFQFLFSGRCLGSINTTNWLVELKISETKTIKHSNYCHLLPSMFSTTKHCANLYFSRNTPWIRYRTIHGWSTWIWFGFGILQNSQFLFYFAIVRFSFYGLRCMEIKINSILNAPKHWNQTQP